MPDNIALWLPTKRAALAVGRAPYTEPGAGEIVVRARAVAINPVDRLMPSIGDLITPWLTYPFILGCDVAGEVAAVGEGVTRFKIGDRVLGHAVGSDKARNRAAEGAFQIYVVLLEHMASPIPDALSFEAACVLPLGLSTAACGLFQKDFLALKPPSSAPAPAAETVLVWGGSTSVGSNAIQLAVAAGYEVGPMIYETFLPGALAGGTYLAAPDPWVVGQGLEALPAAFYRQRQGVSARKLVVML